MKNLIGLLRMPSSLWDAGFEGLMERQSVCLEAANLIEEQAREIERLRAGLERIDSMEAFTFSRAAHKVNDAELIARQNYARAVLEGRENEEPDQP